MSIALDCTPGANLRLAVALRAGRVVVLEYDTRSPRFIGGFNVPLDSTVPRCVSFTANADIHVLGLYDGKM